MDGYSGWCCWWPQLWFLVTAQRPPRILATNRSKEIEWRAANPFKKVKPWQEDASQKVEGSHPGTGKGFFLTKYLMKCTCTIVLSYNWYFLQVWVLQSIDCLMCIWGRCSQNSNRFFLNSHMSMFTSASFQLFLISTARVRSGDLDVK